MDREEILKKIAQIREELSQDQYHIISEKIAEKRFHLHRSNRNVLTRKIIEKFRKRLIQEIELILEPMIENQKEINLRFLEEIERLKKACLSPAASEPAKEDETKSEGTRTKG